MRSLDRREARPNAGRPKSNREPTVRISVSLTREEADQLNNVHPIPTKAVRYLLKKMKENETQKKTPPE